MIITPNHHHHNTHSHSHNNASRMNKGGGGSGPPEDGRPKDTLIKDLKPGSKHLNMLVIILDISKMTKTKDGHEIRTVKVADKSGSINLTVWDKPGTLLQPGDIIRLQKAYCNLFKNCLTLYIGKGGELVRVGDFCLVFSETPNLSEKQLPGPQPSNASNNQPNISGPGPVPEEPGLKH